MTTLDNINYVFFDLDGTLTDSAEGITKSARHALEALGIEPKDDLKSFIGPPLYESFKELYGLSLEESDLAIKYFREYFSERGVYEHRLYDGIRELLSSLKERGKSLVLATSKPEKFAISILEQYKLEPLFSFICGASMDETRCEKADVISYAIDQIAEADGISKENIKISSVMIGDRRHDILGAKKCGLISIGVTFGFGSREELSLAGADFIIDSPKEIDMLIK